jgi:8-oxo-dGTP pyrophosphatase MutT (NUDIX family)
MEPGESLPDTLVREVREETGYRVVLESIGDYLLVHEKRNGNPDDWLEMDSWYYFCDVEEKPCERDLDEYEKEYDYRVTWMTLAEMLQKNEAVTDRGRIPWVTREAVVMRELYRMETAG